MPGTARVHNCDAKKVCCSKCDKKFKSKEEKEEHIKEVHFETITCNICGQSFVNRRNMKRHIDSVHANAVFPCDECDQICSRKGILETHRKAEAFQVQSLIECEIMRLSRKLFPLNKQHLMISLH